MKSRLLLYCLLFSLVGCAAHTPFASRFEGRNDAWAALLERAKRAPASPARPVVVGVVDAPRSVFAYDLAEQRMLFRQRADVVALPWIASDFAVVPEAAHVLIRRLRDGAVVHEIPSHGMRLVGAAGDGALTAIVLSTGGPINARSRFVLLSGESVSADQTVARGLGVPAVLGGMAFIPHQRVHVSAIAADGQELARLTMQHDVASYAFRQAGDVFFGQRAVTLLDAAAATGGPPKVLKLELRHKLPGSPAVLPDAEAPAPPVESALHRIKLTFLPQRVGEQLGLVDDSLYLAFYRLLFGLTPDGAAARWVHESASDLVGVRAVSGGVIAVESRGAVSSYDTRGKLVREVNLGLLPVAASIRAERMEQAGDGVESEPIALQLERAVRSADTRLVPAREFAATLLGAVEGEEAARALVSACSDQALPERVREASCEALVRGGRSSDALVAALATRPDFLAQRPAPPLVALARAAAKAGDRRAVPALLSQLESPATSSEELLAIVAALAQLGDAAATAPLVKFVRLYHADVVDDEFEGVLVLAMDAISKLDKEGARPLLESIAADQLARPGVRGGAERALAALGPREGTAGSEAAAASDGAVQSSESGEPPGGPPEQVPQGPPAHLTSQHVEQVLAPLRVQLSRCVREAPERPASARLVIVIEGEGTVSDVKALPESVRACVAPLVATATFPATKYGRRSVMSYVVAR